MNDKTEKTCADKVKAACESRLESIRVMLNPQESDITLGDDGSLDTVLYCDDEEFRYTDTSEYRDEKTGEFDLDSFLADNMDDIRETMYERFHEYGLSFDYVEPGTFENQDEGYLRYQISYGGPSEEIRFFVSPTQNSGYYGVTTNWHLYRAEFWYLDWFDGARVDVTKNPTAQALYEHFNDCESVKYAIDNS